MRKAYSPGKPSELKIISIIKNNKGIKYGSSLSKYISSKTSYTANQIVYILNDDTTIREIKIPKNIEYLYYTSADVESFFDFLLLIMLLLKLLKFHPYQ